MWVGEVGVGYGGTRESVMRVLGSDCERSALQSGPVRDGVKMIAYFSFPVPVAVVGGRSYVMTECGPILILQTRISFEYVQLTPYAIEKRKVLGVDVPGPSEIPLEVLQQESPEVAYSHKN